jgi:hypothetical protein
MNGKNYDETLNEYRELNELLYENVEAYCKGVNRLQSTKGHKDFFNYREISTLEEKIQENNYDSEAIKAAKLLFNANYENLEAQFNNKRTLYENKVKNEMNRYKNVASAWLFVYHSLQLIAIGGAALVAIAINIPAIPKVVPTVISGVVTLAATFLKFYKFRYRYSIYSSAHKKLQKEYDLYLSDRAIYDKLQAGAKYDLFMDRIDIIHEEIRELFSLFDELAQQQDNELEQEKVMQAS